MLFAEKRIKAPVGKAFSNASIGEADEKAFPAGADSSDVQKMSVSLSRGVPSEQPAE